MKTFTSALLALVAATSVQAVDKTVNADLDQKLKLATTNVDRQALLKPSDWTFDFTKQAFYTWSPGGVVNANAATFPAAAGLDMTVASLLLGPCAMLPPHYHPRATNFVVAINGSTTTNMIAENGVDMVTTTLTAGQLTIFPKGSLHTMQNNGCDNTLLMSFLNSEDAGTHNVANGLWNLPPSVIAAAFGNKYSGDITALKADIPAVGTGAALGDAECLKRCHIS